MAVAYAHNGYFTDPNCTVGSAPYLQSQQAASGAWEPHCVVYSGSTSIAPVVERQTLSIAPNPANNSVRIELGTPSPEAQLTIYDLTGKIVAQHRAQQVNQLDLSDWNTGLYFVKLTQPNGNPLTQKLLVN